jgi:hypothetical protein
MSWYLASGTFANQRPGHGGTDPGPRNLARDRQNSDLLAPPSTDHGTSPNLRFSFADAHMRLESGGWTRQVTAREFVDLKGGDERVFGVHDDSVRLFLKLQPHGKSIGTPPLSNPRGQTFARLPDGVLLVPHVGP